MGATADGPVTSLAKFGAFVDLGDGIEGMIHIGDISHEKRLNHPSDALKVGDASKVAPVDKLSLVLVAVFAPFVTLSGPVVAPVGTVTTN